MTRPRPYLCLDSGVSDSDGSWSPSDGNTWWRPRGSRYPATSALLPGDVLLFQPVNPDLVQKAIESTQKRFGQLEKHARFTHSALYVGFDHLICEATSGGVGYSSLEDRLLTDCVLIRRVPGLTLEQRWKIVENAVRLLGKPYAWNAVLLGILSERVGAQLTSDSRNCLTCSRLVDRSITSALLECGFPADAISLASPETWVTPAVLSATSKLEDVDVGWQRSKATDHASHGSAY